MHQKTRPSPILEGLGMSKKYKDFIMINNTQNGTEANIYTTSTAPKHEHLLGVPEICQITGLGEATAAKIIKESGHCIYLHQHLYILESSFFAYLRSLEAN